MRAWDTEEAMIASGRTYGIRAGEEADVIRENQRLLATRGRKVDTSVINPFVDMKCSTMGFCSGGRWEFFYQRVAAVTSYSILEFEGWKAFRSKFVTIDREQTRENNYIKARGSDYLRLWV